MYKNEFMKITNERDVVLNAAASTIPPKRFSALYQTVFFEWVLSGTELSKKILFIPFVVLLCFCAVSVNAQGDLMITPKRALFDANRRQQEINLVNTGKDTSTYLISIVNMSMTDSGRTDFITQSDSTQNFADQYLRIYPRKVTLWPGKSQVIKLQMTRYHQLAPGEYRSHVYFRAVTDENPLGEASKHIRDTTSIFVYIKPLIGFTIPVIIRIGVGELKVDLSDAAVVKSGSGHLLNVTLNRQGNISAYGALAVKYISPDGSEKQVGFAKGISIYTTNERMHFQLKLKEEKGIDYNRGSLHLVFKNIDAGKSNILAESELALGK
jgi:hypothetical protein